MQRELSEKSFEELAADLLAQERSHQYLAARAELDIRQIKALLDATAAQQAAAKAEQRAADAAQRNANYMLASVIVALLSAIASAVSAYFAYLSAVHPK